MKSTFNIRLDDRERTVQAQIIEKKVWFKIDDEIYSYDIAELADTGFKKSAGSAKSADKVAAPMPGKVTKIFISEGQNVNKGDALLVMEAMKMEYTLKSDLEAKIEKLAVKVGDQVTLGQLMVQLKEQKS